MASSKSQTQMHVGQSHRAGSDKSAANALWHSDDEGETYWSGVGGSKRTPTQIKAECESTLAGLKDFHPEIFERDKPDFWDTPLAWAYHNDVIVNKMLVHQHSLTEIIEALARDRANSFSRIVELESLSPRKIRTKDGRVMVWHCPDHLIPLTDLNVEI